MANPFDDLDMAEGYANARPNVHRLVIERVSFKAPLGFALDLGCGAGLSTVALEQVAHTRFGIDPAEAMIQAAQKRVPDARFAVASAEEIPLSSKSVDLISAAGSLNYVNFERFFAEARRVLKPGALIVVYDFSPGKSFANDGSLEAWFGKFSERYPWPAFNGHHLNPQVLGGLNSAFRLTSHEDFAIPLPITLPKYVDYMMTETNVAQAVEKGVPRAEIRGWCEQTLAPIFASQAREVFFKGYFACLTAPTS
jgi:ubiquinone/menaquinone biosynthesis C-methylase UbiE